MGKLLGAGIGGCLAMLLEGPLLVVFACALTGGLLGHLFFDRDAAGPRPRAPGAGLGGDGPRGTGRRQSDRAHRRQPVNPDDAALTDALTPLFIEVARADGEVRSDEVRAVRAFFERQGFDEAALDAVRVGLKAALGRPPQDVEALVRANRSAITPALRPAVLRAMYEVVLADGPMGRAEQDVLKRVVQHFNLSDEQLLTVTGELFGSGEAHYQTLGLTAAASDDDVRAAFRRLAAENHPDRVATLGPAEAEAAAARFRAVKEAWEALKQLRGL
ncbi:MAG: molecular chaperone DjiA [Myxococcaceae bacterium]|nr:molecular chaperone DjiA [Myxococcaceae bacterium]